MNRKNKYNQKKLEAITTKNNVKTFIKSDIDKIATTIALMYDVNVYEKTLPYINKPMANIAAGHALNINWDNIAEKFNIIKNLLSHAIYQEDTSFENIGNKIVKRSQNGDISISKLNANKININNNFVPEMGDNIAFKNKFGDIEFCNNKSKIADWLNIGVEIHGDINSGYAIFPGGFIEQWMHSPAWPNHNGIYSFPIPFPNDCLNIIVGRRTIKSAGGNDSEGIGAIYRDRSTFLMQADVVAPGFWVRACGY